MRKLTIRARKARGPRRPKAPAAVGALGVAVALVCAACGSSNASGSAAPTQSGTSAPSASSTVSIVLGEPLSPPKIPQEAPYIAQAEGFFKKEGLNVTIKYMPNGLTSELGTTAGSITIGMAAGSDSIEAAAQGAPIHAVWVDYQKLDTVCIGTVKSIKDLAGKNIGSTGPGGFGATTMGACLKSAGLSLSSVKQITMTRSEFIPALSSGRISAAIFHTDDAYTVLHSIKNARILQYQYKSLPNYWYGSLNVKDAYAQAHPAVVEKTIAALIMADRWMMNPANNSAFISLASKNTGESVPAVTYAIQKDRSLGLWNTNCSMSTTAVTYTSNLLLSEKAISKAPTLSQVYNGSYCAAGLKMAGSAG